MKTDSPRLSVTNASVFGKLKGSKSRIDGRCSRLLLALLLPKSGPLREVGTDVERHVCDRVVNLLGNPIVGCPVPHAS